MWPPMPDTKARVEPCSSLIQLLLDTREFHQGARKLLFVFVFGHGRFFVFQPVDFLLEIFFFSQEIAFRRIGCPSLSLADAHQSQSGEQESFVRLGGWHAPRCTFSGIFKLGMLARHPVLGFVNLSRSPR